LACFANLDICLPSCIEKPPLSYEELIASSNFDEFNNVLQKFENAISLVDKHEKLLDNEFQTKKTMLDEFKKLASDIFLSQKEHDSYQKKIMTCESEIQKVNEDRLKLIRTKNDLLKAKKDIENSKMISSRQKKILKILNNFMVMLL
jgi:hypothetical protein